MAKRVLADRPKPVSTTLRGNGGARIIDKTGMRFGLLTVIDRAPTERLWNGRTAVCWNCRCDCGTLVVVHSERLKLNGDERKRSCGCDDRIPKGESHPSFIHGLSCTPEYGSWACAKRRTTDKDDKAYAGYGGRGISMCPEWLNDFSAFYRDMGKRPKGKTLGRIDNDGNYEKSNCRWETPVQQNRNRRDTVHITAFGECKTSFEWGEITGIPYRTIQYRIRELGWSAERALSQCIPAPTHQPKASKHSVSPAEEVKLLSQIRIDIPFARLIASRAGSQYKAWDVIMTAEEVLAGNDFWPYESRAEALWECASYFQKLRKKHETPPATVKCPPMRRSS